MTLATFTPPRAPDPGTLDQPEVKLLEAEFGDGYTQTTAAGLNHIRRNLSLTWSTLSPTQANAIINFLKTQGGFTPFYYTPSDESTPVKWTCKEWKDEREKSGFRKVTATFRQSFNLVT